MDKVELRIPIVQVERETGITKETLRKWESRYGFPNPDRHENGERLYTNSDLQRLKSIKRLMDAGHRPGKIVPLSVNLLSELQTKSAHKPLSAELERLTERVISSLRDGDVQTLTNDLETALLTQGLNTFVEQTLPPLITHIGDQWGEGALAIHQEHLFSEVLRSILQHSALRLRGSPAGSRVVLGTAPDELHGMGLVMLQAVLSVAGAQCINLGTQVPIVEFLNSARSYRADVVAISLT
ncbi:MAG: MerR family transcriptional regulator [Anaerolineales bacterium]|nr:MerR family transcriptional regulator [Anaerolineales bacterium]